MPAMRLQAAGYRLVGLFRNPNIHPLAEYLRRRESAVECARRLGMELIIDDDWDLAAWLEERLPLARDPGRCRECVGSRLKSTFETAKKMGFPYFSSSLLYSRYQPHDYLAALGRELSSASDSLFVYGDFRKDWQEGVDVSKDWGLYRQPYCGCVFSESERYAKKFLALRKNI